MENEKDSVEGAGRASADQNDAAAAKGPNSATGADNRLSNNEESTAQKSGLSQRFAARLKGLKVATICVVVGVALGIAGTLYIQSKVEPEAEEVLPEPDKVSVVFDRVVAQNELTVASRRYTEVDKATDSNEIFGVCLPFTENSFWYRSVGTIKVSVDLSKAELALGGEGNEIVLRLENPYISSNDPDMEESGVLEERNNALNPIRIEDVDAYRKDVYERIESAAGADSELMDAAKSNAQTNIDNLFKAALGENYHVTIEWVESEE